VVALAKASIDALHETYWALEGVLLMQVWGFLEQVEKVVWLSGGVRWSFVEI
jgi:hypothetical protein